MELLAGWSLANSFHAATQKYATASEATRRHCCGGSVSEVTPTLREKPMRDVPERRDDQNDAKHGVHEDADETHGEEEGGGADAGAVEATEVEDVEEGGEGGEEEQAEDEAVDRDHFGGVDAHANEPEEKTRGVAGEQQEVEEVAAEHGCGETTEGVLGGNGAADLGIVCAIVASRWKEGTTPTMR